MKAPLVFDIYVEEYSPHRVMRQFGRHQAFPLVHIRTVPVHVHRYICKIKVFVTFVLL